MSVQTRNLLIQVRPHNPREKTKVMIGMTLLQIIDVVSSESFFFNSFFIAFSNWICAYDS